MKATVGQNEGDVVWFGGIGVVYKIPGSSTGGRFSLIEHVIKPGTMTAVHLHHREDEFSYVLEGVLGAEVGGSIVHAKPGEFVLKPREVMHTFWNEGPDVLRFLELISPAGFENFFAEGSKLVPATGQPDEEGLAALSRKYGLEVDMDHVTELMKRFNVRLLGFGPPSLNLRR